MVGDRYISLAEAALLLHGRGGRPPHVKTLRIWADPDKGCYPLGPDGPQIILMTVRMNGNILTLKDWVMAFEKRRLELGKRVSVPAQLPERTSKKRAASHARAERELDRMGVGTKGGAG